MHPLSTRRLSVDLKRTHGVGFCATLAVSAELPLQHFFSCANMYKSLTLTPSETFDYFCRNLLLEIYFLPREVVGWGYRMTECSRLLSLYLFLLHGSLNPCTVTWRRLVVCSSSWMANRRDLLLRLATARRRRMAYQPDGI